MDLDSCSHSKIDDSKQQKEFHARYHLKVDQEQLDPKVSLVVLLLNKLKIIHQTMDKTADMKQLSLNRT